MWAVNRKKSSVGNVAINIRRSKECPAFGQQWSICHKLSHFAKVWSQQMPNYTYKNRQATNSKPTAKKRVYVVDQEDNISVAVDEPQIFINALHVHGVSESSWFLTVSTESGKITFTLDTGAEASVLPLKIPHNYNTLSIWWVSDQTCWYLHTLMQGEGHFTCYIHSGLIQRVHALEVPDISKDTIRVEFADVFRGLGNLGKYHITLKDEINPVIHPAQRVPHSLLDKLKKCLEVNLKCDMLKEVDQPTNWMHNLIIVEKKNGSGIPGTLTRLSKESITEYLQLKKYLVT